MILPILRIIIPLIALIAFVIVAFIAISHFPGPLGTKSEQIMSKAEMIIGRICLIIVALSFISLFILNILYR